MNAEVKTGYKLSEVGSIPEEWNVVPLSAAADIRSGLAKNSNVSVADPIKVHYLRVANVQNGYLDLSEMSEIEVPKSSLKRFEVLPGDVLMNEGGDLDQLGRGSIWRGEFIPCIHQNHVFVVRSRPMISAEYLSAWTQSLVARRYFMVAGKQTTNLASINKTSLGCLPVAIPSLIEQRAIAAALTDMDALISGLDQLIAKKRDIKQAAMQQLLTGQTRLPGFSGEWEVKRLGDIAEIDPESLPGNTAKDYTFKYISLENVDAGRLIGFSEVVFSNAPSRARRKLRRNDVLISTVRPNLMSHLLFSEAGEGWVCSTGFSVVRCGDGVVHPEYIFACFFGGIVNRQIDKIISGSNYPSINSADVNAIEIPTPSFSEQTAIATILSEMDAELAGLEIRRDKAKQLKQGMMQELLTGRIRLI